MHFWLTALAAIGFYAQKPAIYLKKLPWLWSFLCVFKLGLFCLQLLTENNSSAKPRELKDFSTDQESFKVSIFWEFIGTFLDSKIPAELLRMAFLYLFFFKQQNLLQTRETVKFCHFLLIFEDL